MSKRRWSLLSTTRINGAVIPPIRASARGELVTVASRKPAKAEACAKEHTIPKALGSYEAMLASDEVDVIYVPQPGRDHRQ